jgi:hypothetical protein
MLDRRFIDFNYKVYSSYRISQVFYIKAEVHVQQGIPL